MRWAAFNSKAEVSCAIANLLHELDMPCQDCGNDDFIVLTGSAHTGEKVTVRLFPDNILEIDGCDALVDTIRERGCLYGKPD